MRFLNLISVLFLFLFYGCKDNYKTIPKVDSNDGSNVNIKALNSESEQLHTVIVNEVLPTTSYTYLYVSEEGKNFWIAVNSIEAKVGETYFYVGGLLKKNFESKTLNKVFDELYLVGNLVSSNHGNQIKFNAGDNENTVDANVMVPNKNNQNIIKQKGSIKISELVNESKNFEGKKVQIDGECTKINVGIMGKNWIHLRDGSKDDFDLVITSDALISVGSVVTIKGDVVLNKDFRAGYKYDLILENGILVNK